MDAGERDGKMCLTQLSHRLWTPGTLSSSAGSTSSTVASLAMISRPG